MKRHYQVSRLDHHRDPMNLSQALQQLTSRLRPEQVRTDEATLSEASRDRTEAQPQQPLAVVKPHTVAEVQAVVHWANETRIPLTPVVANTNLGGLAIPAPGGVVVDLKEMNRIVEVDETAMYALLEPGVTFGDLRHYLDAHYPHLTACYPLSPPEASVLGNCLLDGLTNLSFQHGAAGDLINGLEVVLPTGELLYTGSAALRGKGEAENLENGKWKMENRNPVQSPISNLQFPIWTSRAPLPDLTGLFLNWQGTTGIVTKLALQLWPRPAHRQRQFILAYDRSTALGLIRQWARYPIFDDLGGVSWVLGKMMFGVIHPRQRDPQEPEFFIYIDQSADTEEELYLKQRRLEHFLNRARHDGAALEAPLSIADLIRVNPALERFGDFPMSLDFLLDYPGGGLTWVGTYGPLAEWEEGTRRGEEILAEHGFPPAIVVRAMRGGHFGVLRFILVFNQADSEEVARVRRANAAICDAVLDLGFIPYKTPIWAVQRMLDRLDPGFLAMLKTLKRTLDPNGIMNPGKWLLGPAPE